jgi:uncharacterized RDD family membrane protein YckC
LDWFYTEKGKQLGPVVEAELSRLVHEGIVNNETLVWRAGMETWQPYATAGPQAPPQASADVPRFCSSCGKPFPSEDLALFGSSAVCAACKPAFVQGLRQGAHSTAGASAFRYAGFWIRTAALFIDGFITGIVSVIILLLLTGGSFTTQAFSSSWYTQQLFSLLFGISYYCFFWTSYGATPGKMALGLKIITPDGGPISLGRAIGRYFSLILSSITLLIGFMMAGWDSEKRSLHDRLAGTRVIRTR